MNDKISKALQDFVSKERQEIPGKTMPLSEMDILRAELNELRERIAALERRQHALLYPTDTRPLT